MKRFSFLLLNTIVAVVVVCNSGCLSKSRNKSSALRYDAAYIANRRIFSPIFGEHFDGKAKYVFHGNNTCDYYVTINGTDWTSILKNVPYKITSSSVVVDWSSCTPETYCGKSKNDTDPEVLNTTSSDFKLVKITKKGREIDFILETSS